MRFETEFISEKGEIQYINSILSGKKEGLKPGKIVEKFICIFPDNKLISLEVTEGESEVSVHPFLYQLTSDMTHESCVELEPRRTIDGTYEFIHGDISYVAKMMA